MNIKIRQNGNDILELTDQNLIVNNVNSEIAFQIIKIFFQFFLKLSSNLLKMNFKRSLIATVKPISYGFTLDTIHSFSKYINNTFDMIIIRKNKNLYDEYILSLKIKQTNDIENDRLLRITKNIACEDVDLSFEIKKNGKNISFEYVSDEIMWILYNDAFMELYNEEMDSNWSPVQLRKISEIFLSKDFSFDKDFGKVPIGIKEDYISFFNKIILYYNIFLLKNNIINNNLLLQLMQSTNKGTNGLEFLIYEYNIDEKSYNMEKPKFIINNFLYLPIDEIKKLSFITHIISVYRSKQIAFKNIDYDMHCLLLLKTINNNESSSIYQNTIKDFKILNAIKGIDNE